MTSTTTPPPRGLAQSPRSGAPAPQHQDLSPANEYRHAWLMTSTP